MNSPVRLSSSLHIAKSSERSRQVGLSFSIRSIFPTALPSLQRVLVGTCLENRRKRIDVDQLVDAISSSEPGNEPRLVLRDPARQVVRDADVECAVSTTG